MNHLNRIRLCLTIAVVTTAVLCLAACNTMEGAGRDVEDAGQAVQDAAD